MSETMVPTMNFRWLVPNMAAYAAQPECARLQQANYVGGQLAWRDVPVVADASSQEFRGTIPPIDTRISEETKRALAEIDKAIVLAP